MAHKTLVGGTAYEISGGKTLIGGTAYSIAGGKTLVGGTAYDISFLSPDPILANNDPATIQKVTLNGQAENYWSIGDIVPIVLNGTVGRLTFSNETYYAFIIGFNHNLDWEAPSGSVYSIHFQFGKTSDGTDIAFCDADLYSASVGSTGFCMNTTNTSEGGWGSSYMRSTICPAFKSAMPTAWQNVIKACTKYTDNTGERSNLESDVTATSDEIFLLSEFEVFGTNVFYGNSAERNYQKQYSYYNSGNSAIKYRHYSTGSFASWWLRSVSAKYAGQFCLASTDGDTYKYACFYSYGFAPGFMVA